MKSRYSDYVESIKNIPWSRIEPARIVNTSLVTGLEFAQSLRIALMLYPDNQNLIAMAKEELETTNLFLQDYNGKGDHVDFLLHFCSRAPFYNVEYNPVLQGFKYLSNVGKFSPEERAMTVFSREKELPGVFSSILKSCEDALPEFYVHYLRNHIDWDSKEGGHADLVSGFELDEDVLLKFYKTRYDLYASLLLLR